MEENEVIDYISSLYDIIKSNDINSLQSFLNDEDLAQESISSALYDTYQELKLKNVYISAEVEYITIAELTKRRFLSNNPSVKRYPPNPQAMIESLTDCTNMLITSQELNQQFFFIAKFVCQNIYMLKRFLKDTYDSLPWEEMEFCLIIFVYSHTKQDKSNILYKTLLGEDKIKTYLHDFLQCLKDVWTNSSYKTSHKKPHCSQPKCRELLIQSVKNKHPGKFDKLYDDFVHVRDIYTLDQITDRVKCALGADIETNHGQLSTIRCLQFIGESMKNTRDSPKLSKTVAGLIQASAPKNMTDIVTALRNSLSHKNSLVKRTQMEEDKDIRMYRNIQNDLTKIQNTISDILRANKTRILKLFIKEIIASDNPAEMRSVLDKAPYLTQESFYHHEDSFATSELQRIKNLVEKMKGAITGQVEMHQESIFDEIERVMNRKQGKLQSSGKLPNAWFMFENFVLRRKISEFNFDFVKKVAISFYDSLFETDDKIQIWNEIKINLYQIYSSLPQNISCEDEICTEIQMISYIIDSEATAVESIRNFKEKVSKIKTNSDITTSVSDKTTQNTNKMDQLKMKSAQLTEVLLQAKLFSDQSSDRFTFRLAIEMLVSDVMTILNESLKCLVDNTFVLYDDPPILYGKCFRNYLAHDNPLLDILAVDPWLSVLSNAQILKSFDEKAVADVDRCSSYDFQRIKERFEKSLKTVCDQSQLFRALHDGDFKRVQKCVRDGADVMGRNLSKQTSLHVACESENLELIEWLVEQDVNTSEVDVDGLTALHVAAAHGTVSILEYLIVEMDADVNCVDSKRQTPLHLAASFGRTDAVKVLLKYKADTFFEDKRDYSPLMCALQNKHFEIVDFLLKNATRAHISKALNLVTELGYVDLIKFVVENYLNGMMTEEKEVVTKSIFMGYFNIVKLFFSYGAVINYCDDSLKAPLFVALDSGNRNIIDFLIDAGADVNATSGAEKITPLQVAASKNDIETVSKLLLRGADINAVTAENVTALQLSVSNDCEDTFYLLIENNAKIDIRDFAERSALHLAAVTGNTTMARKLIEMDKTSVNCRDLHNYTPVHMACYYGHERMVQLLIESGAEINTTVREAISPLYYGIRNKHLNVCKVLLKNNVKIDRTTADSPLHLAAMVGDEEILKLFLREIAQDIEYVGVFGETPLGHAIMHKKMKCVELLLRHGARVESHSKDRSSPMELAILFGGDEIFEILLKKYVGCAENENRQIGELLSNVSSNEMYNWLLRVTRFGNVDKVRLILDSVSAKQFNESQISTLLRVAVKSDFREIVKVFLEKGFECRDAEDEFTPLFLAAYLGFEDVLIHLLKAGADANHISSKGLTPLHVAVIRCHIGIVDILLSANTNVHIKDSLLELSALEMAVYLKNLDIVQLICEKRNDIDYNGDVRFKIPHVQVNKVRLGENVAKYFVKQNLGEGGAHSLEEIYYGPNTTGDNQDSNGGESTKNDDGRENIHNPAVFLKLPLSHFAIWAGSEEIFEYLVQKGADIHAKNISGEEAFHFAARRGQNKIIKYLLEYGVDVDSITDDSYTALHLAASKGHRETVQLLINNEADVSASGMYKFTPIDLALNKNHESVVDLLLENGAVPELKSLLVSAPNEYTKSKIYNSVMLFYKLYTKGSYDEVEHLIRAGAVNSRDYNNMTPLMFAINEGNARIAKALLDNGANPDAIVNGSTAMHCAALGSSRDIVLLLLSHGAVYDCLDGANRTPYHYATDDYVSNFLSNLDKFFRSVRNDSDDNFLDSELVKLKTQELKAVFTAYNQDRRSLVTVAIESNYKKVHKLKNIQGDEWIFVVGILIGTEHYQHAMIILEKVLTKKKEIFREDDPAVLDVLKYKIQVLIKQQRLSECIVLIEYVYTAERRIFGKNNEITLKTGTMLAVMLQWVEEDEKASKLTRKILNTLNVLCDEERMRSLEIQTSDNGALVRMSRDTIFEERSVDPRYFIALLDKMSALENDGITPSQSSEEDSSQTLLYLTMGYVLRYNKKLIDARKKNLKASRKRVPNLLLDDKKFKIDVIRAISNDDRASLGDLLKKYCDTRDLSIYLHTAILKRKDGCVDLLLEYGVDPFRVLDEGITTLNAAVGKGTKEIILALLRHVEKTSGHNRLKEYVNSQFGVLRQTALHLACQINCVDTVRMLLKYGASKHLLDLYKKKPIEYADNEEIKKLL